ncbi:LexA repressor [Candidatus Terasakiella magnetica]|uniref:LexA repressor n=1 Tax=Candidatus Terasakiella magnetica TaxID=1867952 RepID=A0A1C3RCU5_9PROT|nr:transcriptional repressor LexA [Candidatus Terasakiella magnetica]SCA55042.1 LexA repressor [Candidatus Terasakiella magnetica]
MLTKKQYDLLLFLEKRLKDTGVSPSYDEMKEALDLKSKSGIHRLITGLEERGFIRRLPHRARAVEVLRVPENQDQLNAPLRSDSSKITDFNEMKNQVGGVEAAIGTNTDVLPDSEAVELPMVGKIAAGTPIEALQDNSNHVDVPASLLGLGNHYALEVEGDSMIEAGINDGDTVVIQKCTTAENGAIVVALVDQEEATLKTLRRKGGAVALEPANAAYQTRTFQPERVRIQGRLVGLIRKY